jgi:hypothetical protein
MHKFLHSLKSFLLPKVMHKSNEGSLQRKVCC